MLLTMESKTAAHHKLELLIEKGRATAGSVVEHVMKHQPEDRLVRSKDLAFVADPGSTEVSVSFPNGSGTQTQQGQNLHRNALTQMAGHRSPVEVRRRFAADGRSLGTRTPGAQPEHGFSEPHAQTPVFPSFHGISGARLPL